jgi:hypothetical protein
VADVLAPLAASDVACPSLSVFTAPTCVPSSAPHPTPTVTSAGWHRKNVTVPVGVGCPAPPVTVAVSVTADPGTTPPPVGVDSVTVVDGCLSTVKHSVTVFV